jgi:hypothetical protein
MSCETPIVFFIFRRPELTMRVFEAIRQAQPQKLLVVADGPRNDAEALLCQQARSITEAIEWDCEVLRNYADENLGCRKRISSGLDWAFEQVEEAIILEDDCLPDPSFFPYCQELLIHYRQDNRIMSISGDNFQFGYQRTQDSYYYSKYFHCWGWASWRRAWLSYDSKMSLWPAIRDGGWLNDCFRDKNIARYWKKIFQEVYENKINTWDYQWTFASLINNRLNIIPNINLVSNIGFSHDSTHTNMQSDYANLQSESLRFPIQHPPFVIRNELADHFIDKNHYKSLNRDNLIKSLLRRIK